MLRNNLTSGYVLLVGIPVLILIGMLRAGGHLVAPPALSGEWIVEQTRETPLPDNCAGPLAHVAQPSMSIYQTGADLLVAFNDPRRTTLAGRLENGRIAGIGNRAAAPVKCGDRPSGWRRL